MEKRGKKCRENDSHDAPHVPAPTATHCPPPLPGARHPGQEKRKETHFLQPCQKTCKCQRTVSRVVYAGTGPAIASWPQLRFWFSPGAKSEVTEAPRSRLRHRVRVAVYYTRWKSPASCLWEGKVALYYPVYRTALNPPSAPLLGWWWCPCL